MASAAKTSFAAAYSQRRFAVLDGSGDEGYYSDSSSSSSSSSDEGWAYRGGGGAAVLSGSDDESSDDEGYYSDGNYGSSSSSSSDEGWAYSGGGGAVANSVRTVNVALYQSNTLVATRKLNGTLGARAYDLFFFLEVHTKAHDVHFSASDVALLVDPALRNRGPDSADAHANCITVHRSGWDALAAFVGPNPDEEVVAAAPPPPKPKPKPVATHRALRRVHSCW